MATIHDVAKAANVSAKTVSRVLNGDAPVNARTRETIEQAMTSLGYVPSSAARMMRSNRSGIVGLVTGAISAAHDGKPGGLPDLQIVQGIQQVMTASAMTLMIADTGGNAATVPGLVRSFLQYRVEGLIYVAPHHQKIALPPVSGDSPVVLANCFDDAGTPAVIPDDRAGQRALVSKLIRAGHRRIAYLALPDALIATGLRIEGYRDAHAAAGLTIDPALLQPAELPGREQDALRLAQVIDALLALDAPPTVLCCGNDKMAMQAYGILRSRGIEVPGRMSVCGYDNYRLIAESLYPPLTTVELPYHAMGAEAARKLLRLIADEAPGPMPPTLLNGPVRWRSSVLATELCDPDFEPEGGGTP
ncbi:LacI family DNA-binding transcriptional regulator [Tropicimonas sp. IMCC34043]|uniref:LacI family DNA-binding transcriptional regulator n=1 Tax=Tropicimonas sp. IMCC34043 TaxID=2248760 RepID=UPI000E25430D|nr:LacI family DNA-binding transcriptional regulator [Tropicimonas sp. IMCC34043]